jgi:hypothetical protein
MDGSLARWISQSPLTAKAVMTKEEYRYQVSTISKDTIRYDTVRSVCVITRGTIFGDWSGPFVSLTKTRELCLVKRAIV